MSAEAASLLLLGTIAPSAAVLLLQATIASSAAALLIIALRKLARRAIGARAAYLAWLLVPLSALVLLLPEREQPAHMIAAPPSGPVGEAVSGALEAIGNVASPANYAPAMLAVWIFGALLSFALVLRRHRAFVRALGEMHPHPDGSLRAAACNEPLLLGVFRPRPVLPPDFDTRYGPHEQAMVLAHEHAHLRRRDPLANAVAHVWLCLTWFNPLMYWALRLFQFDQELACDASVLALPGSSPRRYADALLKTQLAADDFHRFPRAPQRACEILRLGNCGQKGAEHLPVATRLGAAGLVERNVLLSLVAPVAVPVGFTVADEVDRRQVRHGQILLRCRGAARPRCSNVRGRSSPLRYRARPRSSCPGRDSRHPRGAPRR